MAKKTWIILGGIAALGIGLYFLSKVQKGEKGSVTQVYSGFNGNSGGGSTMEYYQGGQVGWQGQAIGQQYSSFVQGNTWGAAAQAVSNVEQQTQNPSVVTYVSKGAGGYLASTAPPAKGVYAQ